ncbi:MAG: tRNA adenosine(34) deaminase TadA [Gammaproteobacteria bacterium]|nr:tRNA adenosine(34) deaminase TadA [Gammaproteobacteria bacterium]
MNDVTGTDLEFMRRALALAEEGAARGEVPVGAVLVKQGEVVAEAFNQPISSNDPTAHAEILALRQAGKSLGNYRLTDTTLYVTLEPCTMCAGSLTWARVGRLVFAASEPRTGAAGSVYDIPRDQRLNHRLEVTGGVLAEESAALLQEFFRNRR